ncbi:hypothetical protein M5K25_020822 [Dendrobium thyrsiflorum]|uniref:Uncharacterized protein n=1 Tax=Dendrobium thyrsiflorum TaxID=117978 RepID=A0ABD0UHV7_DENTH
MIGVHLSGNIFSNTCFLLLSSPATAFTAIRRKLLLPSFCHDDMSFNKAVLVETDSVSCEPLQNKMISSAKNKWEIMKPPEFIKANQLKLEKIYYKSLDDSNLI